jgi:hypothetical protein
MAKVEVSRAELAELLGLAPDVDDASLQKAMDETLARRAARDNAERDRQLKEDDKRTVAAAVADGRITAATSNDWIRALKTDRAGTRRVIASLSSTADSTASRLT